MLRSAPRQISSDIDRFAQRVDRRVGHLRELLAEIVVRRAHALDSTAIGVSSPIEPTAS
jgi:predicted metal-dependent peptidase